MAKLSWRVAPDLIHVCSELWPTAEAQNTKIKLVLPTVECKGLPPRSADSRTWCPECPEMNWRVKAQFPERIRMVAAGI
jgi:hypothetical protein